MITTALALEASDTWKQLAALVPTIELYLEPQRAKSEVRLPPGSKPPINLMASDLLMELDTAASFYVSALVMETSDVKRFPDGLAAQLALIGERYGHFTSGEEKLATDYCDEAHELMRKVEQLVTRPAPPKFMGPCQQCDGGELWLKSARPMAICDQCDSAEDLGTVRQRLHGTLNAMLVRRKEIQPALKVLGSKVTTDAVHKWVQRGRLVPAIKEPEMFRMSDALELVDDVCVAS